MSTYQAFELDDLLEAEGERIDVGRSGSCPSTSARTTHSSASPRTCRCSWCSRRLPPPTTERSTEEESPCVPR